MGLKPRIGKIEMDLTTEMDLMAELPCPKELELMQLVSPHAGVGRFAEAIHAPQLVHACKI